MPRRCSTVTFCGDCGSGLEGLALKDLVVFVVVVVVVAASSLHSHLDLFCIFNVVVGVVAVVNSL